MTQSVNNNGNSAYLPTEVWNYFYGPNGILTNEQVQHGQEVQGGQNSQNLFPPELSWLLGQEFSQLNSQSSKAASQAEMPHYSQYLYSPEKIQTSSKNNSGLSYDIDSMLEKERVMGILDTLAGNEDLKAIMNSNLPHKGVILAFAVLYLNSKEKVEDLLAKLGDLAPNTSGTDEAIMMAEVTRRIREMGRHLEGGTNSSKLLNETEGRIIANQRRV